LRSTRWTKKRLTEQNAIYEIDKGSNSLCRRHIALHSFIGKLTALSETDGQKLYPFESAPFIGTFNSLQRATEAEQALGPSVVEGDLKTPAPWQDV
jgi:hypothetical protein